MKLKILSQVTVLLLLSVCIAEAANTLTVLGRNPFYTSPLQSVGDLNTMMRVAQDEVKEGLTIAGVGDIFDPLMEQFQNVQVFQKEYPKGQTLEWMFYKRKGKGSVRVMKNFVWDGDEPFSGYEFDIDAKGKRYTFVVPLICGNLALKSVVGIPAIMPVAQSPANPPPPVMQKTMAKPAIPVVEEKATPINFVADFGYIHQFDPANYAFGRFGIECKCETTPFSVLAMFGAAPVFRGLDGKSAVLVDVIGQYRFSRMFVGLGVGAWITSGDGGHDGKDTDMDLIANFGVRIQGEPDTFNTSLFIEARSAVDELDDFSLYGRVGAGLRFRF